MKADERAKEGVLLEQGEVNNLSVPFRAVNQRLVVIHQTNNQTNRLCERVKGCRIAKIICKACELLNLQSLAY